MKSNKNIEKVYNFIVDFNLKNGYNPSVREICKATALSSTSTIAYYLDKLEKEGKIKRSGNKNRAMEIINKPIIKSENFVDIPLVGQIAAGKPILAMENLEENFKMPQNLFHGEDLFMLRIVGESMINVGINNGDLVIIKKQNYAENGEIVAALVDDSATVKRFYKEKSGFRLQPENDTMSPIYVDEIEIIGKVVGLVRKM